MVFSVAVDGTTIYTSPTVTTGTVTMDLNVTGAQVLRLGVSMAGDNINYDHADWADARLLCS